MSIWDNHVLPDEIDEDPPDVSIRLEWQAVELEAVIDGYMCLVTRSQGGRGRWRWVAAPFEIVRKWNRGPADIPEAKGYCGSRERAIEMAEAAVEALKASAPKKQQET